MYFSLKAEKISFDKLGVLTSHVLINQIQFLQTLQKLTFNTIVHCINVQQNILAHARSL